MRRPSLLLFIAVLFLSLASGCGGPDALSSDAGVSVGPTDPVSDAGASRDAGAAAVAGTDAGSLAAELWTLQEQAEGASSSLSDSIGDVAVSWVQQATRVAQAAQPVTSGTLTQAANGTLTYSALPADRLVLKASNGATANVRGIQVAGSLDSANFPSCPGCRFAGSWESATASVSFTLGPTQRQWSGLLFYELDSGVVLTGINLTQTRSGDASSLQTDVVGTVTVGRQSVSINHHVFAGSDSDGPFQFLTSTTSIVIGADTFVVDRYNGLFMKAGQTLPHLAWAGFVRKNGTVIGQLEPKVLSATSSGKLVQKLVHAGTDTLDLGTVLIEGSADITYDSRHY